MEHMIYQDSKRVLQSRLNTRTALAVPMTPNEAEVTVELGVSEALSTTRPVATPRQLIPITAENNETAGAEPISVFTLVPSALRDGIFTAITAVALTNVPEVMNRVRPDTFYSLSNLAPFSIAIKLGFRRPESRCRVVKLPDR
jgi:hypothetical protein